MQQQQGINPGRGDRSTPGSEDLRCVVPGPSLSTLVPQEPMQCWEGKKIGEKKTGIEQSCPRNLRARGDAGPLRVASPPSCLAVAWRRRRGGSRGAGGAQPLSRLLTRVCKCCTGGKWEGTRAQAPAHVGVCRRLCKGCVCAHCVCVCVHSVVTGSPWPWGGDGKHNWDGMGWDKWDGKGMR